MKVLELKAMFTRQIKEYYKHAKQYQLTCDQLTESLTLSVWTDPRFRQLPRHAQTYIEGYHQAVRDRFWKKVLEWRVVLDGRMVPPKEVPVERWADAKPGCHVYKCNPSKLFTAIQE